MPMTENLLTRVRALLAKAESTEFEHEAEAFNQKAAELIARHGIDEALLAASGAKADTITSLTIDIDNPYAFEKASLLNAVAKSLRCQALAKRAELGGRIGTVVMVGYSSDLERVTLIYTSLLLQATSQVTRQRPDQAGFGRNQSVTAFRKAWWAGFSTAVRERLQEAERRAAAETIGRTPGVSTDLVLRDRSLAVRDAFREMFPRTQSVSRGVSNRGGGYSNGRSAGERADLGATRLGRRNRAISA